MGPLTISILNHNGGEVLDKCLLHIFAQDLPKELEVQLVDNLSTDNSGTIAYDKFPINCMIKSNNKFKFITGLNESFRYAKYDTVLFVTQDVFLEKGSISSLLYNFERFERSIIQPVFYEVSGGIQNCGMRLIWPGYGLAFKKPKVDSFIFGTEIFATTCFMMSKRAFKEIGFFDEELAPAFYEDVDYSIRARKLGYRLLVDRNSRASHIGSHSFSIEYGIQKIKGACHRNRLYLVDKHFKGLERILRKSAINLIDLSRVILSLDISRIFSGNSSKVDASLPASSIPSPQPSEIPEPSCASANDLTSDESSKK